MERMTGALEFGEDWKGMLKQLADAEVLVDVYLCSNAYGHQDDRERMVSETHGVRIIYIGEDFFIVGPRRPVPSSIIPLGWISMIRIHENSDDNDSSLVDGFDEQDSDVDNQ